MAPTADTGSRDGEVDELRWLSTAAALELLSYETERELLGRLVGSPPMEFEHVLVVGAGQMGGGIAQVVAASGRRVTLHDPFPGAVERGLAAMRASLDEARPRRAGRTRTRRSRGSRRPTSSCRPT